MLSPKSDWITRYLATLDHGKTKLEEMGECGVETLDKIAVEGFVVAARELMPHGLR